MRRIPPAANMGDNRPAALRGGFFERRQMASSPEMPYPPDKQRLPDIVLSNVPQMFVTNPESNESRHLL